MQYSLGNMLKGGGALNPDGLALDLAFALDKTLTARTGPTPTFSRASSGLFVNANGILVGKTAGTTVSLDPTTTTVGTTVVVVAVASGSVVGWLVGQSVSLIVDSNANNAPDTGELWLVGDIVSTTATQLVFRVTSKGSTSASATAWTLGYRGARFDHDPATGASEGLLIEESRTNFATWSEKIDDASWTKTFCTADPNVTDAPNGLIAADKIIEDTTTNFHGIRKNTTVATGTAFIASIYLKAGGRNFAVIYTTGPTGRGRFISIPVDGTGTVLGNVTATDAVVTLQYITNGWYRATIEVNSGTGFGAPIEVYPAISGTNANYLGDGVSGIFVWGAQLEAGADATSYIPTTSGSAARSADVCSITGDDFSSFYNQSEGTLFAEHYRGFKQGAIATIGLTGIDNGKIQIFQISGTLGTIEATIKANDNSVVFLNTFPPISGVNKTSLGYKLNDSASSCNGSSASTDTNVLMDSTRTLLVIGSDAIDRRFGGHIARIQYFRKRLPNAKLQSLTAP